TLVRADVRSQDDVELVADFRYTFAGGHVPQNDAAAFGLVPPASQEQLSIPTEMQHVRHAFGKWEHTDQLQGICVVKQHLLLPGDGGERSPWTNCQRRNCCRASRMNHGL